MLLAELTVTPQLGIRRSAVTRVIVSPIRACAAQTHLLRVPSTAACRHMNHFGGQGGPVATFTPQHTPGHVLCCLCGVSIPPNPSNMCVGCIRSQVDITEGLQKQVTLLWCKECGRYLQPPKHWVTAAPESKELLTFCIKRLKGLQKVKLVDAGFVWTEPHSRRIKVKLTIQAEVMNGAILQQTFVIEFVVEPHMCMDCTRANTNSSIWTACAQVRQHTGHKRTFFYLEQLILKYNVDQQCINIKEMHQGVDFFFSNRAHALRFIDFVQGVVPMRYRADKQLVSHNEHSGTYNYKYTFSVEIVPVCRDDLVCLPPKACQALGGFGPLALCTRVSNTLTLTDPQTLRSVQLDANQFWRHPFRPVMGSRQLVEFVVLDVEQVGRATDRMVQADVQVVKASDFGRNDRTFFVRTHLGHLLAAGDCALGYDMSTANTADPDLEAAVAKGFAVPDVILVRKSYEDKRRRRRARGHQRPWRLKRMAMEAGEEAAPSTSGRGRDSRAGGAPRHEQDMERFMQELEEDPDMRAKVALYRDPAYDPAAEAQRREAAMSDSDGDGEDGVPQVPLEELLDGLDALHLDEDGDEQHDGGGHGAGDAAADHAGT